MSNPKKLVVFQLALVFLLWALASWAAFPVPSNRNDFFLPGSQSGQGGQLQTPNKCDNCHGGYSQAVEPAFNWRGSMMAQAARDPLFFAALAIANQDAPQAGELCLRCHSPAGWLERRSQPADGSALNKNDREGVQCDLCHRLVKPSALGVNPYPDDAAYTSGTYPEDQSSLAKLDPIPGHSANGMYVADPHNGKRGPFRDAVPKHPMFYSPFHREAALCGTCHDASNPIFTKVERSLARQLPEEFDIGQLGVGGDTYIPNAFGQAAPSFDPYTMFPLGRTYSEWKMSAYNSHMGVYAPQFGNGRPYVSACQDCHMNNGASAMLNKGGPSIRPSLMDDGRGDVLDEGGPPIRPGLRHDMTGGNSFVVLLVRDLYPAEVDAAALNAGVERALGMLRKAASIDLSVTPEGAGYRARVRVANQTGHKLPSGNPLGRRMWLNVKAYDTSERLIFESGAYNPATAELARDAALKVYEMKPGISGLWGQSLGLPAGPSFHLALNNYIAKDNRIPPRGFTNANFAAIGSPPVGHAYGDGQYWDETDYRLPGTTGLVVATLYYQTLSREYVEFLRDENRTNRWGQTLFERWAERGKSVPVAMASDTVTLRLFRPAEGPAPAIGLRVTGPNPFNAATQFDYSLPEAGPIEISVFNLLGQKVATLAEGRQEAGEHSVSWSAGDIPSGVYFVLFTTPTARVVQKVVLLK